MKELGLPKNRIRAALPYKGGRPEIGREILGEALYHMNFTDVTGLIIFAVKDMIAEGIAANNMELTRQLTEEIECLRKELRRQ